LLLREIGRTGFRLDLEQTVVNNADADAIFGGDPSVRIVANSIAGQEFVLHPFPLRGNLVVPGRRLDLGHYLGAIPLGHLAAQPVNAEL